MTPTCPPRASAKGHEDPFPPPGLAGRYVIRQETLAGMRGNGQDAPIPAVRANTIDRLKSKYVMSIGG